jgi:DNA repair protein RecO (recombination protein O)
MSEIKKDEAFVLDKIDYGNTSIISHLFSKSRGRYSVIVKGAKNPKSKYGALIDPLNLIESVVYFKERREVQLLSDAAVISGYVKIKEDIEKLKYAYAVLELVKNLIPEHEENEKLFRGVKRIFDLFEASNELPEVIFGRFFMFFITLLGYEIQLEECAGCGKNEFSDEEICYNYNLGLVCPECRKKILVSFCFSTELFKCLKSLKYGSSMENVSTGTYKASIVFMENYLRSHINDFRGIKSLQIFKEI